MKIIHVVHGIEKQASGPSISVPALCQAIADKEVDLELHVCNGTKPPDAQYAFYRHAHWKWLPRIAPSPSLHKALKEQVKNANVIHIHGLWSFTHLYPAWAASGTNCRFVVSPRGTLNPYARKKSRFKKGIIWYLWQKKVLEEAACFHATSIPECEAIRNEGLKAPIALIPNGIDIPNLSNVTIEKKSDMRRLLYLGRITPVKGIENLLEAWAAIQREFPEWELHITGTDDRGYEGKMKRLAKQLKVERVRFTGPVYGEDKTKALLAAELFVLPSRTENFGMAVAEALAHGVPAIVAKGAPWERLNTHDCGWWVDIGSVPLIECLRKALLKSPQALSGRGARGREWMERDFSWSMVGEKMFKTYQWLLCSGAEPEWIERA